MTLASMTGFARTVRSTPLGTLAWELKTVNAKGLDIRLRVPAGFDAQEAVFRTRIAAVLGRGTCQATLSLARVPQMPELRIDKRLLRSVIDALSAAVPPDASIAPVSMDGLLALRGIVELAEPLEDPAQRAETGVAGSEALDEALEQLLAMRRSEGRLLGALLMQQLDRIGALAEAADAAPGRRPQVVRDRIAQTIAALTDAVPALDPNRLHQEALLLAARADIQEELDRLRIHRKAALEALQGGGVVGRRLDFLAQELAREANTLCAKSNDAGLTGIGLDLRNQIEQFREQVQNLE